MFSPANPVFDPDLLLLGNIFHKLTTNCVNNGYNFYHSAAKIPPKRPQKLFFQLWHAFFFTDGIQLVLFTKTGNVMGNLLYVIAVILIILWLVGLLGFGSFGMGNIIHVLLVIAVIAIILRLIRGDRVV